MKIKPADLDGMQTIDEQFTELLNNGHTVTSATVVLESGKQVTATYSEDACEFHFEVK